MPRRRKGRRRLHTETELLLAAMVDMMVNVLLFLLTLYGAGPGADLGEFELAEARAQEPITGDVHLTITPLLVAVDGSPVLRLDTRDSRLRLPEEDAAFDELASRLDTRRSEAEEAPPLAVEIDRRVPWSVVRPLLDLAAGAGFTDLRFTVASVGEGETPNRLGGTD